MKIIIIAAIFFIFAFLIFGCSNRSARLIGNVYTHQDDSVRFVAGFDKDTLFYTVKDMLNDSLKIASHRSKYTFNKINDSTFLVVLTSKPKFWETNTWEIVIDDKDGLYSANSKRYFKHTDDKNILK
ncbi:MAG: hypothetical protein M3R36_04965 [Bacteroidota bacterium]|nr:hypothetical protein [Bacteroidota bacterium]